MKEMVEGKAAIQSDLHFTYSSSSMDSVRPLEALPNGIKKGVATRHSDCSWLLQQRIKGFVKVLVVGLLQGRLPVIPISKYQIRDFSCQGNENEEQIASMLSRGIKFEIEAISAVSFSLLSEYYIPKKISTASYV
eukprot:c19162_g1_i9 orf=264-668(-)